MPEIRSPLQLKVNVAGQLLDAAYEGCQRGGLPQASVGVQLDVLESCAGNQEHGHLGVGRRTEIANEVSAADARVHDHQSRTNAACELRQGGVSVRDRLHDVSLGDESDRHVLSCFRVVVDDQDERFRYHNPRHGHAASMPAYQQAVPFGESDVIRHSIDFHGSMIRPGALFAPICVWQLLQSPDVCVAIIARVPAALTTFALNGSATATAE